MKISYNWLKKYIPIKLSVEEFCDKLTMFGLEVEEIINLEEKFENIVIGKIISISKHPNSDHLSTCLVDIAEKEPLSVICGAPNVGKNQTVVLAKIGAKIGEIEVKKVKLRGIKSFGMICSEKELGLSENHSGIMILDEKFNAGEPISKALNLADNIIEVEVTPNRPDLLGMIGLAREIGVMIDEKYSKPKIKFQESSQLTSDAISIEIKNPKLCPRYCCRIVRNVTIKSSPDWLQQRLRAIGLRSINNVVDVTNFVLMEYGQPLHAFDYDKISGKKIIVRTAKNNEQIELLDEENYKLKQDNLVIADAEKPIALAGIMGGMSSCISPKTKDIVLECAHFEPKNIRATSYLTNLESDSSHRFERGTNPNGLEEIIDRAAQLIQQVAGGEICKNIVDVYPKKISPQKIFLRTKRVNDILNINLKSEKIKSFLQKFEFTISEKNNDFEVTIPTFRPDIEREIDLIEEIARRYGYQNITSTASIPQIENRQKRLTLRAIKNHLVKLGFFEVCNLSFSGTDVFEKLNLSNSDFRRETADMKNPLGEQFSILRTTLIPDLLRNVATNLSYKFEDFKLFEMNNVYFKKDEKSFLEKTFLTGTITGKFNSEYWNVHPDKPSFFDVKGVVESILEILHIPKITNYVKSTEPYFVKEQSADLIFGDEKIGSFGVLSDKILSKFEIKTFTLLFDIDLTKLLKHISQDEIVYSEVIKFPPVLRDIALISAQNISVSEIEKTIKSLNSEIIRSVSLFDVYAGKQIEKGHRSLAFRITFQSEKSTLTDNFVDKLFDKIVRKLSSDYKIKLRKK